MTSQTPLNRRRRPPARPLRSGRGLAGPRDFQRRAQFYLDFVEADNSTGFHAPQESVRVLTQSVDFSRKGQRALRDFWRAGR